MIHYFTLPGLGGSDSDHWQSHFENILPNCKRIEQQNWEKPDREVWIKTIDDAVRDYDLSKVVFISHSLGGIALSHWVNTYKRKIKGALIVAPPVLDNIPSEIGLDSFLPVPKYKIDFPTLLVASTNDPWADLEASLLLAQSWGSEFVSVGEAGHINSASGLGEWKEGLSLLGNLLDS